MNDIHRLPQSTLDRNLFTAVESLYDRGACFVPVLNKAPRDQSYLNIRPAPSDINRWLGLGYRIGLVPHSLGLAVVDVDYGSPNAVTDAFEPLVVLDSYSRRNAHLYYHSNAPMGNAKWKWEGAGGDIRSAKGYVVLWQADALNRLAEARQLTLTFPLPLSILNGRSGPYQESSPPIVPETFPQAQRRRQLMRWHGKDFTPSAIHQRDTLIHSLSAGGLSSRQIAAHPGVGVTYKQVQRILKQPAPRPYPRMSG